MRDRRCLLAACLWVTLLPIAVAAQERSLPRVEGGETGIDAQEISYDQKTDTVVARGDVLVTRGSTELRADEVQFNRTTNEAVAHGHVRITDPDGTIVADEARLNLDEETGQLGDAEITSRRFKYTVWGDHVEKGLGQSYHIENGRFTSCNCGDRAPDWSISGEDLDLAVGGYGRLRSGTFNVLGVPIFYLPRAAFPAQRERASGLLLPRFGASNRRGFQTILPFYWAINKSQDATLAADVETNARVGLIGEYRYLLGRGTGGLLSGSYFNQALFKREEGTSFETTIPENRWSVLTEQDQRITDGINAYTDLLIVSDDTFFRDMNIYAFDRAREVGLRTSPFTASRAGTVALWDRFAIKGEGTYYQDLTADKSSLTLQRAPQLDAWGQIPLGQYLLGDLATTVVDFQRGQSTAGVRLDFEPTGTLMLPLGRFAYGSISASLRETAYHLTDNVVAAEEQVPPPAFTPTPLAVRGGFETTSLGESSSFPELPRNQSRTLVELRGQIGTTLDRIYPLHWLGLEKVKHTLEPTLEYLYVPSVAQSEQPLFDGVDRVNHRNLVTYGMVSRLVGKFEGNAPVRRDEETQEADDAGDAGDAGDAADTAAVSSHGDVRELGRLSLYQSVDLSREIDPLQVGRSADHFSDIDFGGRINPSPYLNLRFLTNYDAGNNNISAARVGMFVEDPRRAWSGESSRRLDTRTSAGVSYRVLTQNLLQEVDGNFVVRVTDWAGLLYTTRYDLVAKRFLGNDIGLRLISTCDCWAFDLAVIDRTNPQEVEVRAQFTLAGFSSSQSQSRVARGPRD